MEKTIKERQSRIWPDDDLERQEVNPFLDYDERPDSSRAMSLSEFQDGMEERIERYRERLCRK